MPYNLVTKLNIDTYLKELAKEYKKLSGRMPIQLLVIGGSSIVLNYGFRDSTVDIDAFYGYSDAMKQAIVNVSYRLNLPRDWVNDDFKFTTSFTTKLLQYSIYYKTFANVLEVRTIKGSYLIAMKLNANRDIKHDKSDVVGIIKSEKDVGNIYTFEDINKAYKDLYGKDLSLNDNIKTWLLGLLEYKDLDDIYEQTASNEQALRANLIKTLKETNKEPTEHNINQVLDELRKK